MDTKSIKKIGSSLLGASIGWWIMGPMGALLGLIFGSLAEEWSEDHEGLQSNPRDGFVVSLLVLMAAVMKADGKVVRSELDFVKSYLVRSFGENKSSEALIMLRDILKQDIPVQEVCYQVRQHVDYNSRIQLVHMLFGLANADGRIPKTEENIILQIASALNISSSDVNSLLHMYINKTNSAYKILEIDSNVTDEEVKKAYRKMAVKFHPDKVAHLGPEFQENAKNKFQKVNEAFEVIKKERRMK